MACSPTVTGTTTAALTFESVSTSYSAVVVPATSPATTEALLWVSARQDLGHTPAADWGSSTSDAGWGSLTLSVPVSQTYTYTTAITSTLYGTGYPSTTLSACPSLTTTPVATGANNDAAASHARVVRGIAIGAAVAGVLALLLAIAGLIFFCTRRKPKMPAQQAQQQKTVVVRKNDDNCPHKKPLPCAPRKQPPPQCPHPRIPPPVSDPFRVPDLPPPAPRAPPGFSPTTHGFPAAPPPPLPAAHLPVLLPNPGPPHVAPAPQVHWPAPDPVSPSTPAPTPAPPSPVVVNEPRAVKRRSPSLPRSRDRSPPRTHTQPPIGAFFIHHNITRHYVPSPCVHGHRSCVHSTAHGFCPVHGWGR